MNTEHIVSTVLDVATGAGKIILFLFLLYFSVRLATFAFYRARFLATQINGKSTKPNEK